MSSVWFVSLVCCVLVTQGPAGEQVSPAERAARLDWGIKADEKHLQALQANLPQHESEYQKATEEFNQIAAQLAELEKALQAAQESGKTEEVKELTATIAELKEKRKLAEERLNLALNVLKTAKEQIAVLQEKIEQDRQALVRLKSPPEKPAPPAKEPAGEEAAAAAAKPEPKAAASTPAPSIPGLPALPAAEAPAQAPAPTAEKPLRQEILKAQEEAALAEAAAQVAEQEAEEITERLKALDKSIALEQQARAAARRQEDNAEKTLRALEEEFRKASEEGAPREEMQAIYRKMSEAQKRLLEARDELRKRADQLDKFHAERAALLSEQLAAAREAAKRREEALQAKENLEAIQNPFAPRNLLAWLGEKGPKLLMILLVALGLRLLIKVGAHRIVHFLTRYDANGRRRERDKRASTLVSVFHNTCVAVLYVGAILMALDVVNIPITPLLGGAAVVGLAVAFASQNLIKDYFCGFMILLEDQYGINDVVKIGEITGFVERITLRMTVLRDFDAVHFIPHGQITMVSNLTHKWSRAVFDIGVSYNEDVDRVMNVLEELGREMRKDPQFGRLILDDPEMLGVDAFGDSSVVIKFFIKTKPLEQWPVKRELLRRIKKRFDELGIEIPYPHRTVYHRFEDGAPITYPPTASDKGISGA